MTTRNTCKELEQRIIELEKRAAEHGKLSRMLEARKEQLSHIIAGSPIPTFVINSDHIVTYFNHACENLTGISAGEIIGTKDQWKAFYSGKRPVMADLLLDRNPEKRIAEYYPQIYRNSNVVPGAFNAEGFFPDLGEEGKWLFFTAAPIKDNQGRITGAIETIQDISDEKRSRLQDEAMLRISQALHEYPDLEGLLNYISNEIKQLLGTEASVVLLLDDVTDELYFIGSAHDNPEHGRHVKKVRFSLDQVVSGRVIRSGEPLIHYDSSNRKEYSERDRKMGYVTKNLVSVPLKVEGKIIGVLNAVNKLEGHFSQKDMDLLSMLAGTVALSIENTRVREKLEKAYKEVSSLNAAKDRTINHLSHELRTPVQTLTLTMGLLKDVLKPVPEQKWSRLIELGEKNLQRVAELQEEVGDIMQDRQYKGYGMIHLLFDQCADALAGLIATACGDWDILKQVKDRIEEDFGLKPAAPVNIPLDTFIEMRLEQLKPRFTNRDLNIICDLEKGLSIYMPEEIFIKIFDGLVKNAVENTPDQGRIEISANGKNDVIKMDVRDFGIGIREEYREKIFQGYLPTQDLLSYSTKEPFDFYAGGKGADLLRIKIFSEKYNFQIYMDSEYCSHIDKSDGRACPGKISRCSACRKAEDCYKSGGTRFSLIFHDPVSRHR
jgi:signal transduction histidine kinase